MGAIPALSAIKRANTFLDFVLFLLSFLSAMLFAAGTVSAQFGLRYLPGLVGASISVPTSAAFFVLLAQFTVDWKGWDSGSAAIFAVSGLVYPAAVTLLTFTSNARLGGNLTAALTNLAPLFAISLAVVFLGEALHVGQITGIAVLLGGLGLITLARVQTHTRADLWLLLIPVAAAALRGAAQPLVKSGLAGWPDALAAATIAYVVSASVIWSVRLIAGPRTCSYTRAGVLWFMLIGLCNGLALLTLYTALNLGPVSVVAPVVACFPLLTYAINRLVLRERAASPLGFAGIGLSVLGIILLLVL